MKFKKFIFPAIIAGGCISLGLIISGAAPLVGGVILSFCVFGAIIRGTWPNN
jgi:hypothetical protein